MRQLKSCVLRGVKRGRQWRVPESALFESPKADVVVRQLVEAAIAGAAERESEAEIVAAAGALALIVGARLEQ